MADKETPAPEIPVAGEATTSLRVAENLLLGEFTGGTNGPFPYDSNFTTTRLIDKANPVGIAKAQPISRESKGIIFGVMLNPIACKGL